MAAYRSRCACGYATSLSVRVFSGFDRQNEDYRSANLIEHAIRADPIAPGCRAEIGQTLDVRPADRIGAEDWIDIPSDFLSNASLFVRWQL